MIIIYGNPLSSPTNKVRYVANQTGTPYDFHNINLGTGEHRKPEFLTINPCGKVPALKDGDYCLGESNAIIRYLADKANSTLYPRDLQQRGHIDQWIDFAAQHIATATAKIMFNTYFYKFRGVTVDERSLKEGHEFLAQYLPLVEQQLTKHTYLTGNTLTLADMVMLSALDVCEVASVDLGKYPTLTKWRKTLLQQKWYRDCHTDYGTTFKAIMAERV
jgi:glutathione S-transferase